MNAEQYQTELGKRLRGIRQQQDLTLQQVEERSAGKWKAVVVGAYERGDRAISAAKLAELARFYGVPVAELLPEPEYDQYAPGEGERARKVVLDLTRLSEEDNPALRPISRYAATIQLQRGDYNGRVLSIRHEDMRSLAVIYDASPSALTEQLIGWGVLSPDARRALEA